MLFQSRREDSSRIYALGLGVLVGLSLLGLAASLWAHFVSLIGEDPGARFPFFWVFQLLLFALMLPILGELVSSRGDAGVFRSPPWSRRVLVALLLYYGINFYFFLYWSVDHLEASRTWRMFSSGWLLLFSVAGVYYQVRFSEMK